MFLSELIFSKLLMSLITMPIFESVTVEFVKYSKKITKLSQLSYFCQNLMSRTISSKSF